MSAMQSGDSSPVRIVDLCRGSGGFGFTLSSQGPCVLSSIVPSGPADRKGLKPGDQVIEVNGKIVENAPHEVVVKSIARSPSGVVRLGIRSPTEMKDNCKVNNPDNTEEAAFSKNILNRVDKVVEELKSGQLFMDSPALRQSFSNGQVITEEEIVSDEDLKASFSESIRSESSTQSRSTAQSYTTSRRSSDGDINSALSTPKLSRVLYPVLTPVKPAVNSGDIKPEIRSVVGYLGSIELPASSSLPTASSNAIRNSVRRLRAQQKVHVLFVMEVSFIGVRLVDKERRPVVTYPLKSLAFTGLCSDDKRVFGIVTRKNSEARNHSTRWQNVNSESEVAQSTTINCSCHVFSVDPELYRHDIHENVAEKFGLKCSPCDSGSGCVEFPLSCSPILRVITGLFKERSGSESGGTNSDGDNHTVHRKSRSNSHSSSLSESDPTTQERCPEDRSTDVSQIDIEVYPIQGVVGTSYLMPGSQLSTVKGATDSYNGRNSNGLDKERQINDRTDSGLGSDTYQVHGNGGVHQVNGSAICTPAVNVSYHCRESSADSEMSMGSGQCAVPGAKHGMAPLPQSGRDNRSGTGLTDRSLNVLKESLVHADIGSLKTKSLEGSASISSSTHSVHSLGSVQGDMPMDGRVARWARGFDKLMDDPAGLKCFREFLKKEISEENIVFWIACEKFHNITNYEEMKAAAESIFRTHLAPCASMPVNIDSSAVKRAEEQLQEPNNDMYRLQQQQVYALMKFDSYPRFLKSDLYRKSLAADMEGLSLPFDIEEDAAEKELKGRGFLKKVSYLYPSSEESEFSSGSSRSSFSNEGKRSGRGFGSKHGPSKKSFNSTGDDNRMGEKKKSFLPWKVKQPKKGREFDSQPGSARSSFSSLSDSVQNISCSSESLHNETRRENESFQFCRVVLPDHSSTILVAKPGETLRHALELLCERRHLSLAALDVFLGTSEKVALSEELNEDMADLARQVVTLEHRVLFRLELPDGQTLGVKVRPTQSVRACLEPIFNRQSLPPYKDMVIRLAECEVPLDSGVPVAQLEHQHIVVETVEQFYAGSYGNQRSPRGLRKSSLNVRNSRRGSEKPILLDDSFNDVIRGKKQKLGPGYFDETGVWVPTVRSGRSDDSLTELGRREDSFGKSLLKAQGLFGRKRREGAEDDRGAILIKSGRFGNEANEKPSDVKEIFELISKAQSNRMDDQRGELKGRLELPDFLKLPTRNAQGSSQAGRERQNHHPVVKKTMSSPLVIQEQTKFVHELNARIGDRKTDPPTDARDRDASQRPRTYTDLAVCQMDTSLKESRVVSRPQPPQPVTVNSLRGMHTGAFRQRSGDLTIDMRMARAAANAKPHGMQKYSRSSQSLSSREVPRAAPAVYDVRVGRSQPENPSRQPMKSNPAHRGMIAAYSLPEVNSNQVEVHVPGEGKPKVPFRKPSQPEGRPRPRPITDPDQMIAELESSLSSPGSGQNSQRVTSPLTLPPPPSPPSDTLAELDIANFSPPTPLSPNLSPRSNDVKTPSPNSNTINKTLTPASNERTFVGDTPDCGTPWVPHKGSARKRVISPGYVGSTEKRKSAEEDLVTMDPYVTYEDKDLRVTFV